MTLTTNDFITGGRYIVHNRIGAGGMGAVYRATDWLALSDSTRTVALKRVTAPTEHLAFASRAATEDELHIRLALANEFRTLASLRHPNIISVLDYGFDGHRQPYFTMTLLDNPQTVVEAGHNLAGHTPRLNHRHASGAGLSAPAWHPSSRP